MYFGLSCITIFTQLSKRGKKKNIYLCLKLILSYSKFYKINPKGQTLMSIRQQYIYCNSHAFGVLIDQIKNWILEAYHQQLGEDLTFIIWWLSFYFENIGIYVAIYNKLQGHIDQYKAGGWVGEVKLSSKFSFQFLSILHTRPDFDFDLELELERILTLYLFQICQHPVG